ncbi:MAG: exo-alpha-sialidase [Clostridia bacterium]|nr:exo-alpha-sialidase [Clostridia bacterium]
MIIDATKKQGIVFRDGENLFGYCGWGSVAKDDNGVLYTVWSGNRVGHVCPFGRTYLSKSYDGGDTWSVPMVINDTPLDDRDAGIICLGGEKMLVSWFIHPARAYLEGHREGIMNANVDEGGKAILAAGLKNFEKYYDKPELGGSFVRVSEDGGNTWGETVKLPVSAPHGPIRLSDGSLFYMGTAMYTDAIPGGTNAAYVSRDDGKTWEKVGVPEEMVCANGFAFEEPHAIELPSGRILAVFRAEHWVEGEWDEPFTVVSTYSDDGGKTWSKMKHTGFCGSPPHLMLHSSGALICSVGRRKESYGERAYVSYDGGETWEDEYILSAGAENGDLGYPASVELADGSIFTMYYQKFAPEDGKNRSILYTKWNLK